ncbi:hypothetical protein MUP46_02425 [Patescibacteria group bacterium]|nr:hypothetical protein [Patescibacteria group bacterium]
MSKKPDPAAGLVEVQPLPQRFGELEESGESKGIFYFHHAGDYLYGYLLGKEVVQTLHYPFLSYKMKVLEGRQDGIDLLIEEDQVIEFPGNFVLRRKIDDNELIGSCVKIVFTGKQGQKKGYKVFKDTGTFRKNEIEKLLLAKKRREKKKKGGKDA